MASVARACALAKKYGVPLRLLRGGRSADRPSGPPGLDDLAADPRLVEGLSPDAAKAMALRSLKVLHALLLRISEPNMPDRETAADVDETIDAEEAVKLLGVTKRWLYRRMKGLAFVRRLSRKNWRFVKQGLLAWYGRQRG